MRVGEVLEIPDDRHVKLRIDKASGGMWGPVPFTKTYEYPKRMVKL